MNKLHHEDRTRMYERFHAFEKYHNGLYNRLHEVIRSWIRRIFPFERDTAY